MKSPCGWSRKWIVRGLLSGASSWNTQRQPLGFRLLKRREVPLSQVSFGSVGFKMRGSTPFFSCLGKKKTFVCQLQKREHSPQALSHLQWVPEKTRKECSQEKQAPNHSQDLTMMSLMHVPCSGHGPNVTPMFPRVNLSPLGEMKETELRRLRCLAQVHGAGKWNETGQVANPSLS